MDSVGPPASHLVEEQLAGDGYWGSRIFISSVLWLLQASQSPVDSLVPMNIWAALIKPNGLNEEDTKLYRIIVGTGFSRTYIQVVRGSCYQNV